MTLECDKCGATGSTSATWGEYAYIDGGEEYSVNRILGWCPDCANCVPLEEFGDEERLITGLMEAVQDTGGYLRKRIVLFLSKSSVQRRNYTLNKLEEMTWRLSLIRERKGTEKCLRCGSSNAQEFSGGIPVHKSWSHDPDIAATGFKHPGCGGEFIAIPNPVRLSLVITPNYYTVDGDRIITEGRD